MNTAQLKVNCRNVMCPYFRPHSQVPVILWGGLHMWLPKLHTESSLYGAFGDSGFMGEPVTIVTKCGYRKHNLWFAHMYDIIQYSKYIITSEILRLQLGATIFWHNLNCFGNITSHTVHSGCRFAYHRRVDYWLGRGLRSPSTHLFMDETTDLHSVLWLIWTVLYIIVMYIFCTSTRSVYTN